MLSVGVISPARLCGVASKSGKTVPIMEQQLSFLTTFQQLGTSASVSDE